MPYYRRRTARRRTSSGRSRSSRRGRGYTVRGSGRRMGRGRASGSTIRVVVTTPSDQLPARPIPAMWARRPRRARF